MVIFYGVVEFGFADSDDTATFQRVQQIMRKMNNNPNDPKMINTYYIDIEFEKSVGRSPYV